MRIEEALERFQTQLEADGRSVHTRRQYLRHVRLLAHWARDVGGSGDELEALDHEAIARFLAHSGATRCADGSAKKATAMNCLRSSIKCFFGHCHRAGYIAQDPGRLTRRARCAPPPPRAISEEDQKRLLDVLAKATGPEAERDYMLFHLLIATGVRIGSSIAIDVADVDLDKSEIRVRTMKGDRPDVVFLGKAIAEHLRRYVAGKATGTLFTGRNGQRITTRHAQRRFGHWIKAAGITKKFSPHSCRHAFGMRIYSKTHDLLLTKEALRHRSIASTLVYAKADETRLRAAL